MEDGGIGINEIILQLPIAGVALWALITSIRGRSADAARRAETEKGQQALEAQQLKFGDAERSRRAAMDERWHAMMQQMVANNTSLTEAVKGMAILETQNQRLLESLVAGQQANALSLATITGAMDAIVAGVARMEKSLSNGNADHQAIAKGLVRLTTAVARVEAKLPTPPPTTTPASKTAIEVATFKPPTKADDDEAAVDPAA